MKDRPTATAALLPPTVPEDSLSPRVLPSMNPRSPPLRRSTRSLTNSLTSISLSSGTDDEDTPSFTCRLCHQKIAIPQLEAHTMSCNEEPKPATLSDFRFIRRLGSGSYGEVWLAEHKVTEQAYAMKILDSQKPKFNIDRVMRERDILAQSDHKNVVKMVYAFQEKDLFFMALEFHPRGNLNNLVDEFRIVHGQRGDALPEALVRKILSDVLIALEYLHALGIAHRDLKPENLLVAADGRIVLADFGLASVHTPIQSDCNGQERMTHPLGNGTATDLRASAVGSPLYRAPETFSEVLRKSPLPPYSTHLTDFWSLGVMMHELLTGSFALNKMVPPNDIDDMKDLVREMRAYVGGTRPIFWPSDVAVSRQAKSLVEQLLQSNPFARPSIDLVKAHPFFAGVDWNNMDQYRALFIPVGPQATTANTSTSFSLNLPSPLLRGISFAPPMYAHRAAEFQYAGMAQLLMYNHVRVMEHLTATVAESECALVANRSTSSAVTLVEHDDDDEDESEYVPDLQSDADGANALA